MALLTNVTRRYIKFAAASLFAMFLGSQTVHMCYLPLKDMNRYLEEELQKLPEEDRKKIKL